MRMNSSGEMTVGVVGLGYVGLALAAALGRHFDTIGFDRDGERVAQCDRHFDAAGQVSEADLRAASRLRVTADSTALAGC